MDPYSNPFENEENNKDNKDNQDDFNNPFANEDNNEEFTNPFQAEFKNNENNNSFNPYEENSNKNDSIINPFEDNISNVKNTNINPFIKNNSSIKKKSFNPYENNSSVNNTNNNKFNPYEENNDNNPFEKNNENNPFENNFEDNFINNNNNNNNFNNNDNDNQSLPSFKNFEENSSNPYMNNNNNNNNFNKNNSNNMNSNYNNQGNNYQNNFGGPSDFPNDIPPNPFGNNKQNNNQNYDNNNNSNNPQVAKKIKAIMDMCVSLFNQASYQYENFNIRDAIKTLCKSIKGFDGLKQTIINKKTSFNSLLPKIISLRNKAFSNLQEYRINIYILINLKFRPVQYNGVDTLVDFCKRYILTEPFISFDDIYDPAADQNKKLKFVMNEYFKKGQRMGYKNLLLYGPKGSGKTLAVHALAYDLKGKVAQIEGMELFKIPYFAKEFVKAAFTYMQFKPLIVYIKNMESMFSNMNNFNFIYDRASSSSLENIIFIASTTVPIQKLPKDISKKFHYSHCIRPVDKNQKINIINYISQKIGIKINMSEQDLNSFAFQNLGNYSNEDIFNLIKTAIELKQKEIGDDQENKVYKQGISEKEMLNALNSVKGSLTAETIKTYYL